MISYQTVPETLTITYEWFLTNVGNRISSFVATFTSSTSKSPLALARMSLICNRLQIKNYADVNEYANGGSYCSGVLIITKKTMVAEEDYCAMGYWNDAALLCESLEETAEWMFLLLK